MGDVNSRNQEKGAIFQTWVFEILKTGKVLHVFMSICLFQMFELYAYMCLSFNHTLEVMKNTMHIDKYI